MATNKSTPAQPQRHGQFKPVRSRVAKVAKTKAFLESGVSRHAKPGKTAIPSFAEEVSAKSAKKPLYRHVSHGPDDDVVPERLRAFYRRALARSLQAGRGVSMHVVVRPDGTVDLRRMPVTPPASVADVAPAPAEDLDGALSRARARGDARAALVLNGQDMLSADAFGDRLGVTRETVNTWRKARAVLGLERAKRGLRYPDWQINDAGRPYAVIPRLFEVIGDDPWAVFLFLTRPQSALDGRAGREVMAEGRDEDLIEAARGRGLGDFA